MSLRAHYKTDYRKSTLTATVFLPGQHYTTCTHHRRFAAPRDTVCYALNTSQRTVIRDVTNCSERVRSLSNSHFLHQGPQIIHIGP